MPSPATVDKFVRRSSDIFAEVNLGYQLGGFSPKDWNLLRVFLFDSCNFFRCFLLLLRLMRWLE